jgi:exonuclease SbcD
VSETGQQKSINLVEIGEKGSEISITKLPLKPLHQVRVIKDTLDNVLSQTSDDYVLVVLTDKKDLDVIDMRERVQRAFPNLLNIKRELVATDRKEITTGGEGDQPLDPFSICKSFIGELDDESEEILKAIIDEAIESEKGVE